LASLVWLAAVTTIFFTAPNVQALLAAEVLAGVPWGVFQASTPPSSSYYQVLTSSRHLICCRGLPNRLERLCHDVSQLLLGMGSITRSRSHQEHVRADGSVGLQDSLRADGTLRFSHLDVTDMISGCGTLPLLLEYSLPQNPLGG